MRFICLSVLALASISCCQIPPSTAGIEALIRRRLPQHLDRFTFSLTTSNNSDTRISILSKPIDVYTVSNAADGTIHIEGSSPIALTSGLHYYLSTYAHVDIYWFIGSRLHLAPDHLPPVNGIYQGSSVVPWRYHFNTVTFSYTSAFWTWKDWEVELDWLALRGVNLPLAWVGYEKILIGVFLEAGFSEQEIYGFLSGPAVQAWNRFGNIQGSWGGELPTQWVEDQFELQKKIVARMVELGMTPVLPCFTGFVPESISRVAPNASFVAGSQWEGFPAKYTNDTFLEPFDALFTTLQKSFIEMQKLAYGDVSSFYTLDQYNENNPYSGNISYLESVANNTVQSLKAADENAVWMLQGWLFFSSVTFWTDDRVEAYLSGATNDEMVILDLFSESQPQWQRTNNYFGKPWIWCELHGYGGNMGLYGQIENVTINPIAALANSSSTMVGMGLTMEGQEGNEIMYDLLLDQAWSTSPIDTATYFHDWVTTRYHSTGHLPDGLYTAWETLRHTVYNNTNLTATTSVTKSIFELSPNTTGLLNRTGHHATVIAYNPADLFSAWQDFYGAAEQDVRLWANEAYTFDLADITRQVMANGFYPLYEDFIAQANKSDRATYDAKAAEETGGKMIRSLETLDRMLHVSQHDSFRLSTWVNSARAWASAGRPWIESNKTGVESSATADADFYAYSARNQVTLWGPTGQVSDYASKQWAGLIRSYYVPRWELFVAFTLNSTTAATGEHAGLRAALLAFEEQWQWSDAGVEEEEEEEEQERHGWEAKQGFREMLAMLADEWCCDSRRSDCTQGWPRPLRAPL